MARSVINSARRPEASVDRRTSGRLGGLGLCHAVGLSRRSKPSFILFREADIIRAQEYVNRILEYLPLLESDLDAGCVVTFRRGRIRVRSLPIEDARQNPSTRMANDEICGGYRMRSQGR